MKEVLLVPFVNTVHINAHSSLRESISEHPSSSSGGFNQRLASLQQRGMTKEEKQGKQEREESASTRAFSNQRHVSSRNFNFNEEPEATEGRGGGGQKPIGEGGRD